MEIPENKRRKIEKLAKLADEGILAVTEHLFELEERLEAEIPEIKDVISRVKGDKGEDGKDSEIPGPKGERGERGPEGKEGKPGKDGKDSKVPGPKGEKGDKGERGKDGKDGQDGKDGSPDKPDEIILKINQGKKKIDEERLDLTDIEKKIKEAKDIAIANSSLPITTSFINGKRAKNINFVGATVTHQGDLATVTITGGGGGSGGGSTYNDQTPNTDSTYGLLAGDIDGVNATFTVSQGSYLTGHLLVELNGQGISQGLGANEFQEDSPGSGTFILNTPPEIGDVIIAHYETVSSAGGIQSIVAGTPNVTIDNTDPFNPVISVAGAGTGTVTTFTFNDDNGVTGIVTNATTTPELTLSFDPVGIVKSDGTTLSAAVSGVDYAPAGNYITALTGDVTATGPGSAAATLATVNSNVGSFGSATQVPVFTVNGKGLITAVANTTITPAASSITGGQALTRTNDTNVTLTLGGTPTTALLAATSMTLGWSGQLSAARGGIGQDSSAWAQGDIPYLSALGTWNHLAKNATPTRYLSNTGASNNPAWSAIDLTTGVTGDLPFANLTQIAGLSVLGVTGNSTADVAAITAANDGEVLRRSGTALAFGTVATAGITNNAVTYAKLQQASAYSMIVNNTASAANFTEVSYQAPGQQSLSSGLVSYGGTAPSGAATLSYNWALQGNIVTYQFVLGYATAGVGVTSITITFPSDMPSPVEPSGFTGGTDILYPATLRAATDKAGTGAVQNALAGLRRNAGDTAYEFRSSIASANYNTFWFNGFYFIS